MSSTTPLPPTTPAGGPPSGPANGYGIAALVLGIVAVSTLFVPPVALATGVLATVFGVLGLRRARRGEATNRGQARAGAVLGPVAVVLLLVAGGVFLAVGDDDRWDDRWHDRWGGRFGDRWGDEGVSGDRLDSWRDDAVECLEDADGAADLAECQRLVADR